MRFLIMSILFSLVHSLDRILPEGFMATWDTKDGPVYLINVVTGVAYKAKDK